MAWELFPRWGPWQVVGGWHIIECLENLAVEVGSLKILHGGPGWVERRRLGIYLTFGPLEATG